MTKEELKAKVDSTREKLKQLEEKAFTENKGKYPIIKNQITIYLDDLDFIERNLKRNLDEDDITLFDGLLNDINQTADLDLESFVKENQLDTPVGEAVVALQMAALDVEKEKNEEKTNVEIPPFVPPVEDAQPTEEVVEEQTTEDQGEEVLESANDLDQVNTEEILNSLDSSPIDEVEPIPQDLVNEMINASNEASEVAPVEDIQPIEETTEPVVEAVAEQPVETPVQEVAEPVVEQISEEVIQPAEPIPAEEIANIPTQSVDINAIDNILNTLDVPTEEVDQPVVEAVAEQPVEAPVEEAPIVAEQPVAVEAPITPEMVAAPEVAAPEVAAPVMDAPVAPEAVATVVETVTEEQPVAVEAPVAPEMVAAPEMIAAPVMDATPVEAVAASVYDGTYQGAAAVADPNFGQVAQAAQPIEAPIVPEAPVAPVMPEAPVMEQPMMPEVPVMDAPEGPTLTLTP